MIEQNWVQFGIYSAIAFSQNLDLNKNRIRYNYVGGDYYITDNRYTLFGGELGILKNLTNNFQVLKDIIKNGYDSSLLPDSLRLELEQDSPTRNFDSSFYKKAIYNEEETKAIQLLLDSKQGRSYQDSMLNNFLYNSSQVYKMQWIYDKDCESSAKAFLIQFIFWDYSGNMLRFLIKQEFTTIEQLKTICLKVYPLLYLRFNAIYNYLIKAGE